MRTCSGKQSEATENGTAMEMKSDFSTFHDSSGNFAPYEKFDDGKRGNIRERQEKIVGGTYKFKKGTYKNARLIIGERKIFKEKKNQQTMNFRAIFFNTTIVQQP